MFEERIQNFSRATCRLARSKKLPYSRLKWARASAVWGIALLGDMILRHIRGDRSESVPVPGSGEHGMELRPIRGLFVQLRSIPIKLRGRPGVRGSSYHGRRWVGVFQILRRSSSKFWVHHRSARGDNAAVEVPRRVGTALRRGNVEQPNGRAATDVPFLWTRVPSWWVVRERAYCRGRFSDNLKARQNLALAFVRHVIAICRLAHSYLVVEGAS